MKAVNKVENRIKKQKMVLVKEKINHSFGWGLQDFPGGSEGKASVYNEGDPVRFLGWEDPLEKEMAIHSSILAWKIPQMEEPDRLQSMGSQIVGHD